MRGALLVVVVVACGAPRSEPAKFWSSVPAEEQAAAEPADASEPNTEVDAEPDADLGFLAEPADAAPPITFDDLTEVASYAAVYAVRAAVGYDSPDSDAAQPDEDTDDTYENDVHVVFVTTKPWCAIKGAPEHLCGLDAPSCRRLGACAPAANAVCFSLASKTTGTEGVLCYSTFGDCDHLRAIADLSREYAVTGECTVFRYRKATEK